MPGKRKGECCLGLRGVLMNWGENTVMMRDVVCVCEERNDIRPIGGGEEIEWVTFRESEGKVVMILNSW